ncbi:MAG TPA: YtxH domain-containing protein [bacterium]|nr:YtxH domain-containing protein [bacterium]
MTEYQNNQVKEKETRNPWVTALIGFGAGTVVGAITALLYAPQSGKETREKIKDRFQDVSEKASELMDKSKEAIEEAKDKMASAYEEAVERTSSAIESAKEKLSRKKE